MTPEVVKPHYSCAIASELSRRELIRTKKASRKWLAFNDFYSGGRIRTSDLRVMSVFEASRPNDDIDGSYSKPVGLRPRRMGCDFTHVCHVSQRMGYSMGYKFSVQIRRRD